jgi:hypothetical protein
VQLIILVSAPFFLYFMFILISSQLAQPPSAVNAAAPSAFLTSPAASEVPSFPVFPSSYPVTTPYFMQAGISNPVYPQHQQYPEPAQQFTGFYDNYQQAQQVCLLF